MMQGCGNEIFSIFNRFHRLKISSLTVKNESYNIKKASFFTKGD